MGKLIVDMYGAPMREEFPIVSVVVDGIELDPLDVGYSPFEIEGLPQSFEFEVDFEDSSNHKIEIEYFNDDCDAGIGRPFGPEDEECRNLYIIGLILNDKPIDWKEGIFVNSTPWGGNDFTTEHWGEPNPLLEKDDRPRIGSVCYNGLVTFTV